MINLSPENFGYLQVERRVLTGQKEFLLFVRDVAARALDVEPVTSVTQLGFEVDGQDEVADPAAELPKETTRTLGETSLEISEGHTLRMVLFHSSAPPQLSSRYSFDHIKGQMLARPGRRIHTSIQTETGRHRTKQVTPNIIDQLSLISHRRDLDPRRLQVKCGSIGVVNHRGAGTILMLMPDPATTAARVLYEEADISFDRFAMEAKKGAYPVNPWVVGMPFARIPDGISDAKYRNLLDHLQNDDAPFVRLTLGPPRVLSDDDQEPDPAILNDEESA